MSSSGPSAPPPRQEARETATPFRMEGRVLVVDDTEAKRYFIVKTLRGAGMEVLEAASGQEALTAAALKPDVVVLDVRLPDMSGFEVCRRLKEDPATSALAVLYVSSLLRDEELEARLFDDGADGYLPQPLEPRHLVAQTWALVRMRRAEQARQREREQAQAEQARLRRELERSQSRALRLTESGLVGTFYWDLDGSILDANDTFLAMVGYTREDLERGLLDWRKMTPPEWAEQDRHNVQDVRAHGVSGLREKQYLRKDGTRVDVIRGAAAFESEPHRGVGVVVDISARRDAERRLAQLMEELESKERLLHAVLQQMPTGLLITEAGTGRTLLTNERMSVLLGGTPRQNLKEMRLHLVEHPDGRPCTREELPLMRAMREGREVMEELVVRREDGSTRLSRTCASPVRDARGEIVAGVLTMEDITERKAIQESLRLSEERLRLAMDSAALGVWSYDPARDELAWDARTREMFGVAPGAPVDIRMWLEHVHPDDRERMEALCQRGFSAADGRVWEFEYRALGKEGVLRWLVGRGQRHSGADGKVWHMGTVLDITERKLAEQHAEALLATTATFAHALTAQQVAEALVSHGLKSLEACAGLVSVVAGDGVEVLGSIGYPEEMLRAVRAVRLTQPLPIPQVVHTGRAVWIESIEALERDWPEAIAWAGLSRKRSWGSIPLVSGERVVGVLTLSFPTPRRFSAREKAHLESLCLLGAQALERARVYEEARQRAEQEQQFLGVVSHDLRNPLAAISLGARTLQRLERPTPEALLRMTGRIANSADTMGRMVSDLLDFTRGRLGGGIPLERTHNELVRLCQEVIEEFSVTHPSSDIRLEGDALCEGWWDGPRMRQVLSNLLSNALRHSRPGSEVGVRVRGLDGEVELTVSNAGEPIPAELVPVLFEPFRRGMSKFRPAGSLGLGLFIVHQVVKGHGGRVEVGSAGGVTSFTVRVPRGA
ncbi:PAS domain S-box-containing protein [Archangium gephyra]|uniref:histidine kinase n=1 Tax=Archangium gephyra TaxID=48 RepID=A0AAC8TAZ0_9BACT|nr:PAS domain S-box protein [Archangium gephyra]AKI99082.1 Chemotaxis protein methyltransferase CheR [Archangium gephyra]REG30987.1 PAS domain S-box-containing protein [Archangium gephyra]